jgi:uncharacterized protein (DUF169 family)
MNKPTLDYTIFNRFDFSYKPVGMKFLLNRPAEIDRLDESMPVCRMFRKAQDTKPFYAAKENFACVERLLLGLMDPEPFYESGQIGAKEHIYQEARANRRIYQYVPRLAKGTVRYVAFATLNELPFEPDIIVITASPGQAEIILRALSYSTGKPLTAKFTPVLSCAWLFVNPFVTGEVNYSITGLGYGIKNNTSLPEGMVLISVPYDTIPMLIDNLQEMDWVLPANRLSEQDKKTYATTIMNEINREYLEG